MYYKKYLFFFMFFLTVALVSAQHNVYLKNPNTIPLYAQQTNVWCGAGSAQMMLEGYPGGVEHKYTQQYVWDSIQKYKVEQGWYTDPDGLKGVMNALGQPGVRWNTCYYVNQGPPLMWYIVKWMTNRRFPAAVLVYRHQHWVVIVGATTSANPNNASSVTLQNIEIHDPWQAQHVYMTGSAWYQKYWYAPGNYANSIWYQKFVGVNEVGGREDEAISGEAVAPAMTEFGTILPEEKMANWARAAVLKLDTENRVPYKLLSRLVPMPPMLVNKDCKAYYLVPLATPSSRTCLGGVMLNAYTGEFEAAAVFDNPIEYLNAIDLSRKAGVRENSRMELVFEPSSHCKSPFLPLWKVSENEKSMFYNQSGERVERETHEFGN